MNSKELKELIDGDLFRYFGDISKKTFLKELLLRPGFKYMYLLRKCRFYQGKKTKIVQYIFSRILLRRYMYKYGFQIPFNTEIGKGLYMGHPGGIVVNPNAVIGNNVNLAQGVTIGQTNRGKKAGAPTIGNQVWIGPNSVIVGNIKVGDNVLIAPGSYVNFDVPDNSIVMGNPGVVTYAQDAVKNYVNNKVS